MLYGCYAYLSYQKAAAQPREDEVLLCGVVSHKIRVSTLNGAHKKMGTRIERGSVGVIDELSLRECRQRELINAENNQNRIKLWFLLTSWLVVFIALSLSYGTRPLVLRISRLRPITKLLKLIRKLSHNCWEYRVSESTEWQ